MIGTGSALLLPIGPSQKPESAVASGSENRPDAVSLHIETVDHVVLVIDAGSE
jgi:hypothetical protein